MKPARGKRSAGEKGKASKAGYPLVSHNEIDLMPLAKRVIAFIDAMESDCVDEQEYQAAIAELRVAIKFNQELRRFRKGAKR